MKKQSKRAKRSRLLTRQQLAAALGVVPGTVTRMERDGCPVAKKRSRGRATLFDRAAVERWRAAEDAAKQTEGLSLQTERAGVARETRLKLARENRVRSGELVERNQVVRDGQSFCRAWAARVRRLPHQAAQRGIATTPEQQAGLTALCRELLVEISGWKTIADTSAAVAEGADA